MRAGLGVMALLPDNLEPAMACHDADALRRMVREAHPQVYVFDMLRPEFCGELLEEAKRLLPSVC